MRRSETEAEKRLWRSLRNRGFHDRKFRRQYPIGPFVADFVCLEARLVVELDGGQHGFRARYDEARTRRLNALGFRVIRFWNNEVLENTEGVLQRIGENLRPVQD